MPWRFLRPKSIDGWSITMELVAPLQNLRRLDLKVPLVHILFSPDPLQGSLSRLLQFIQKAPCLDTLFLEFADYVRCYDDDEEAPSVGLCDQHEGCAEWNDMLSDISELLEGIRLSRLRSLRLSSCQFRGCTVIDLLTRHSTALRDLHLDVVEIVPDSEENVGSWKQVMHQTASKMSLVYVHLSLLQDMEIQGKIFDHMIRSNEREFDEHTVWKKQRYKLRQAYGDAVAQYLLHRGQIDYPGYSTLDFDSTGYPSSQTEKSNSTA